jgi:hypothetical protein
MHATPLVQVLTLSDSLSLGRITETSVRKPNCPKVDTQNLIPTDMANPQRLWFSHRKSVKILSIRLQLTRKTNISPEDFRTR